jgi:cysteine desulfurase
MSRVYLDHAATSPMSGAVLDAYTDALRIVGNPSSIHSDGQAAKAMLEDARAAIAASVNADPMEVVFTSGGTEAINLAIKGLFWRRAERGFTRILLTGAEHHATLDAAQWLAKHEGAVLDWVPVDEVGRIDLGALETRLAAADDVALVTTLWANNEVGTVQPVREIVALADRYGVPVHADAVAAYRSVPIDFGASGLAAMSISAHKIGGPVGIGALIVSRRWEPEALVHGGGQQRARSGTLDAAGAHAFREAMLQHAAFDLLPAGIGHIEALRDRLVAGVRAAVPSAVLRGDPDLDVDAVGRGARLASNAHFTFPGCEGDSLLYLLDTAGFSVSTGSACQAGVPEASHVLLAMGLTEADARGALRFTLGHTTTEADVDALVAALPDAVERARRAGMA